MDVLPTGTATSWRLIEPQDNTEATAHTYLFEGPPSKVQGREYLAEQLRQDGAASSLGAALSMVEAAELLYGFLVFDEDTGEEFVIPVGDEVSGELPLIDALPYLVAKVPHDD